jgi:phage tail-like protein
MAVLNDTTNVGLANRFLVTIIPGDYDLGSWQKAEGLDVTWDMPDYRAGDGGNQRWFFPANTKYTPVKLVRAACDDSMKVRDWLNKNSFTFSASRVQVKIQLFDSTGKIPVVEWDLRNALPKKWSINSMDAGASQISIETLEFDHEGFLDDEMQLGQ